MRFELLVLKKHLKIDRSHQLLAAYAMLEPSELAQCFAVAFLADPAGTLLSGTQLAIDARNEAKRLEPADCGFSMPGFREPGTRDVEQAVAA